eukprot:CAMPEP_0178937126 /NCGR_PEP_ID=MMETSP0786-20121207/25575_1 /TAXON_ID=186022 /ORGANISM="Thalassionema frauenfeldii, Strain CCMP 1798" /LENGTH=480 /DNA_ID=CAMNT_0020615645 /DNA_START=105 /DNA_END=1544 /DNA_ORIENTATION=+
MSMGCGILPLAANEYNIRYKPTAGRAELEALLHQYYEDTTPNSDTITTTNTNATTIVTASSEDDVLSGAQSSLGSSSHDSINDHSNDDVNPTKTLATRNSTSSLKLDGTKTLKSARKLSSKPKVPKPPKVPPPKVVAATTTRPIPEILQELDRRNIRYSPDSTRTDLELLLQQSLEGNKIRRKRRQQRRASFPPAEEASNYRSETVQRRRRPRNDVNYNHWQKEQQEPRREERTIFNPVGNSFHNYPGHFSSEQQQPMMDGWKVMDRVGGAVADAAETIIWGSEDNDKRRWNGTAPTATQYWKERVEPQVGALMESIEDGSPGNRNDVPNTKQKKWEEEDTSIVSLLFGRGPKGQLRSRLDNLFDQDVGTTALTKFTGTLFRGGLLVVNYLCRWASVKGTIPQPVVVLTVLSAAAQRRKVNTVVGTLLLLRIVGEFLHGSVVKMRRKDAKPQPKEEEPTNPESALDATGNEEENEYWDGD